MIFFFKSDGTLIKSAPDTVYQGSVEAGKIYVAMPFNANAAADVYFRLPNGENWGPYLLTNHGVVTDGADVPTGWGLWSVDLESAITQYAGTLTAQFGFTQASGKIKEGETEKYPLLTTNAVTITIAKGVTRDLPEEPSYDVYEVIKKSVNAINEKLDGVSENWLTRTGEATIALKNNGWIVYSTEAAENTLALRDSNGRLKASGGVANDDLVTVKQLNDSETVTDNFIKETKTELQGKIDLKLDKSVADTRFVKKVQRAAPFLYAGSADGDTIAYLSQTPNEMNVPQYTSNSTLKTSTPIANNDCANKQWVEAQIAAAHTSVYTYKGSKDTYANLPTTGNKVGDVWNVEDTGINYAWNGADWDSLSANVLQGAGESTIQAMSQKATTDELDKKVDKVSIGSEEFYRVYGINHEGDTTFIIDQYNNSSNSIVARNNRGEVLTATPEFGGEDQQYSAINIEYFDAHTYSKPTEIGSGYWLPYSYVDDEDSDGNQIVNDSSICAITEVVDPSLELETLVMRDANGRAQIEDPINEKDIANKHWTNAQIAAKARGEKVSLTFPAGASSGTLTDEQLAALQASEANYIEMVNDKELYYLNDNGHVDGYLTYSHVGIENSKATIKTLTIPRVEIVPLKTEV